MGDRLEMVTNLKRVGEEHVVVLLLIVWIVLLVICALLIVFGVLCFLVGVIFSLFQFFGRSFSSGGNCVP